MKKKLFLWLLVYSSQLTAQNIGIGTSQPNNKLEVVGSVLINAPVGITATPPTPAQTYTMVNATTIYTTFGDSTGRIYDPGGPAGNYVSNLSAFLGIEDPGSAGVAIEITLEDVQLGTGDSLILRQTSASGTILLAVGNGYSSTGTWIFNTSRVYIIFKSNTDANNGRRFSLLYRRIFDNNNLSQDVIGFAGHSLFFDAKEGALRTGYISLSPRGSNSFAAGNNATASGVNSISLGSNSVASGNASLATGGSTVTSGVFSTAMGSNSTATGTNSIATGSSTDASGIASTAMGINTTASGNYSTTMGANVSSNGRTGSFLIGDASTSTVMTSPSDNNFRARFENGYRLYTSSDYSTSCSLGAGSNAWTTTSDFRLKENFADVDGEDFLKKIATMHLTSWNYKKQDSRIFRHYGPMAQDFYAAFGKDAFGSIGNDTTINQADFAGVSFIAIQALEKRTAQQQQERDQNTKVLKKEIEESNAIIQNLQKQIDELKTLVNKLVQSADLK